jgi:iron complex outermembrane recepter protein
MRDSNTTTLALLFRASMTCRIGRQIFPKILLGSGVLSVSGALVTCPLLAQQLTISGTARDTGGVIPDVAIEMTSPSGSMSNTKTDGLGQYKFESLGSGRYELSFTKTGYRKIVESVVLTGDATTVDVIMAPVGIATSIEVTGTPDSGTASLMPVPNEDIPSQVSTVRQEIIREQGLNDVATALENISGASVQVQYGAYEWYTLDGFTQQSSTDFIFIDGMVLTGNRPMTQLDNVEEIQVLKGADGVLYGGAGAGMGGMVNIIRKKPQATRTTDCMVRGGRFDLAEVACGNAGKFFNLDRLLYRVDGGYSYLSGWRDAGWKRANISPNLLWLINRRMRIAFNESFSKDHYDMDAGVPLALLDTPGFPLNRRLNPPDNFEKFNSWENQIIFNANLTNRLDYRNSFFHARNSDQYMDSETLSYNATTDILSRTDLYYYHHRRPMQDRNDLLGTYDFWGMRHHIMIGYDYEDRYYYTYRAEPIGTTSASSFVEAPINIAQWLQPGWVDPAAASPIASFPLAAIDYYDQQINAEYWQDQINVKKRLRLNLAGRYDFWKYVANIANYNYGTFENLTGDSPSLFERKYTYRYGAVYTLFRGLDLYASAASTFQPILTQPTAGVLKTLVPSTSWNWEAGERWSSLSRRLIVNATFRRIVYYNIPVSLGAGAYDQAGKADANVVDVDIDGDLGRGFHALAVYGYALPRYDRYITSTGLNEGGDILADAPRHTSKIWLTKTWRLGEATTLFSSAGMRYMGAEYMNSTDTVFVGGYTVFSGAVGLRRKKWEVQVNAENLLDRQRYFVSQINTTQLYPGQPINVFATFRYRFQ